MGHEASFPPLMYVHHVHTYTPLQLRQSLCVSCLIECQLPPALSAWPRMDHWEFNECRLLNEFLRGGNLSLWPCSERGLPMLLM